MKLSFKEYYESRQQLLTENTYIKFSTAHDVYKYCRVPFSLFEKKIYIPFKPKDRIKVLWERVDGVIHPVEFIINDASYIPLWNSTKMRTWVEQSTTQIF